MSRPVILYGSRTLARMIFYDALHHPDFRIAAFAVDQAYLSADRRFMDLPQVAFETLPQAWPPQSFDLMALHAGTDSMRDRAVFYDKARALGYRLRNYISPSCDLAPDFVQGDNNIILALSHIGLGGVMGSNNLVRQQVYLGHHLHLGDHNVITPGCRIGGRCTIGSGCYLGLGCTIINRMTLADEILIGAGTVLIRPCEAYARVVGNPGRVIGYHRETGIRLLEA